MSRKLARRTVLGGAGAAFAAGAAARAQGGAAMLRRSSINPGTFDVHRQESQTTDILLDMFTGLMTFDAEGRLAYGMAQAHEASADGLSYLFTLRPALWSDRSPLTAHDFVVAWRRLVDPTTAAPYASYAWVISNAENITRRTEPDLTALGARAIDDRTLEVRLLRPVPFFLQVLAEPQMAPLARDRLAALGEDYFRPDRIVSNGAFRLARFDFQQQVVLRRDGAFYGDGETRLDGVTYAITGTGAGPSASGVNLFRTGEIDVCDVPLDLAPLVRRKPRLASQMHAETSYQTSYLAFNLRPEGWTRQPELRRALSLAVDTALIARTVFYSDQAAARRFVPDGEALADDGGQPARDDRARDLMDQAGYGLGRRLAVELAFPAIGDYRRLAIAIADLWSSKLPIDVTLSPMELKAFSRLRAQGRLPDVSASRWIGDYLDPETFLGILRSDARTVNIPGFSDPVYDAMLAHADETDGEERDRLLTMAEDRMLSQTPVVPLAHPTIFRLVSERVRGWRDNLGGFHLSRHLALDRMD